MLPVGPSGRFRWARRLARGYRIRNPLTRQRLARSTAVFDFAPEAINRKL